MYNNKSYRYKNQSYTKKKDGWYVEYTPNRIYFDEESIEDLVTQLLDILALMPDAEMYSEWDGPAIYFKPGWIKVADPLTIEALNYREEAWKTKDKLAKEKAAAIQREREEKELARLAKKLGKKID